MDIKKRLEKIAKFEIKHEPIHGQTGRCTVCSYNEGQVVLARTLLNEMSEEE